MIMSILPAVAIVASVTWAILLVLAHRMTPGQDALSMGMSGLVHGRARVVMKAAFLARGGAALALVAALPAVVPRGGLTIAGLVLFWLWGAASALLALYDTDMPGEAPTRQGVAHAVAATVAYVAGVAGMLALSLVLRGEAATAGVARWALLIAAAAAVAMVAQFAGFAAAARVAGAARESGAPDPAGGASVTAGPGGAPPAAPGGASATAGPGGAPPAAAPAAASVTAAAAGPAAPPQLAASAGKPAARRSRSSGSSRSSSPAGASGLEALAPYAGLLQRVCVALVMLWVVVVALGI